MRRKINKSKPTTDTDIKISKDIKTVNITIFPMFKKLSRNMEDIKY